MVRDERILLSQAGLKVRILLLDSKVTYKHALQCHSELRLWFWNIIRDILAEEEKAQAI